MENNNYTNKKINEIMGKIPRGLIIWGSVVIFFVFILLILVYYLLALYDLG